MDVLNHRKHNFHFYCSQPSVVTITRTSKGVLITRVSSTLVWWATDYLLFRSMKLKTFTAVIIQVTLSKAFITINLEVEECT